MAKFFAALVNQVFDIAQRQQKYDMYHHAKPNDHGRGFGGAQRILGRLQRQRRRNCLFRPGFYDTAAFVSLRLIRE
jgi:hypothetical protein